MPTGGGGGGSAKGVTGFNYLLPTVAGTNMQLCITLNTINIWTILIGFAVSLSNIAFKMAAADAVNNYDVGFYNSLGTLAAHIGAQPMPSTGAQTFAFIGAPVLLAAGAYFFAGTGNANNVTIEGNSEVLLLNRNTAYGSSSGGALPATITPPSVAPNVYNNIAGFMVY